MLLECREVQTHFRLLLIIFTLQKTNLVLKAECTTAPRQVYKHVCLLRSYANVSRTLNFKILWSLLPVTAIIAVIGSKIFLKKPNKPGCLNQVFVSGLKSMILTISCCPTQTSRMKPGQCLLK